MKKRDAYFCCPSNGGSNDIIMKTSYRTGKKLDRVAKFGNVTGRDPMPQIFKMDM